MPRPGDCPNLFWRNSLISPAKEAASLAKPADWAARWCSASELDLAAKCPASSVLPKYDPEVSDGMRRARVWGQAVHRWVETGSLEEAAQTKCEDTKEVPKWLRAALEKKLATCGITRSHYWNGELKHETCYTYDLGTGTTVPVVDKFSFPKIPGSLRFIVDVERPFAVEDLKTGFHVPPPDTLQLKLPSLALKKPVAILTHWARYKLESLPERWQTEHTDLPAIKEELTDLRERARKALTLWQAGKTPEVFPGEHCGMCKRKPGCPAHAF